MRKLTKFITAAFMAGLLACVSVVPAFAELDLTLSDASWSFDEEDALAQWEELDDAKSYQIKLYRSSTVVRDVKTTKKNEYNYTSAIIDKGTGYYTFEVRAVSAGGAKGNWVKSDRLYIDSDTLEFLKDNESDSSTTKSALNLPTESASSSGPGEQASGWQQDSKGWRYINTSGSYSTNGWEFVNNIWYYFGADSYMQTGWIDYNNAWYYCDTTSGAMLVNTTTPDGYQVNADGAWIQ